MAFTQADADALRRAIADGKGARTMVFEDQTVTFQDIEDMLALLDRMEREAAEAQGQPKNYRLVVSSKGT